MPILPVLWVYEDPELDTWSCTHRIAVISVKHVVCQPEPRGDESGSSGKRPVWFVHFEILQYIIRNPSQNIRIGCLSVEYSPVAPESIGTVCFHMLWYFWHLGWDPN